MKHTHRILALLLALSTLVCLLPASGLADNKVKPLVFNTWYPTQKPNPGAMTVYRLKLTSESVIYVWWKGASGKSTFAEVDFCRDEDCSYCVAGVDISAPASGNTGVVLYPGTYYVAVMDVVGGSKVKFTRLKASTLSPSNTTAARAIAINAGKPTEIIFDKKHRAPRWYKFRLSKKQTVRIFGNCSNLTLYNSKMKKLPLRVKWDSKKAVEKRETKEKLSKGTYYIKVQQDLYSPDCGGFCSIYWR